MPVALLFALAAVKSLQQPVAATASAAAADVDSIDHLVAALYDVISGPAGKKRDWDRLRSLFMPDAKMAAVVESRAGTPRELEFSVDRYAAMSGPVLEKEGFYERELSRKQEVFGHIAQVFSTYESRHVPGEQPFERGVNSLQLFNDGKRWWLRTILWEGESKTLRLPKGLTR